MPRIRVVVYSPQLIQDRQKLETYNENSINIIPNMITDSICLFHFAFHA